MSAKINLIIRLQHWMDSVPGQTFLNYAYSWGASIVILGALFKLTHLPGGNLMLFIGMGTEVVVFFLSAFDRPFDKAEIGKELPHDYETDEQIAARLGLTDDEDDEEEGATSAPKEAPVTTPAPAVAPAVAAMSATPTPAVAPAVPVGGAPATLVRPSAAPASHATTPDAAEAAQAAIAAATPEGAVPFDAEARRLAEIIRLANDELLKRAQAVLSPEMESATGEYITKLKTLSETFEKVDQQSARLALDSEEMNNLSRTLTAINKTYDLHFKSISQQVGTIEEINKQTQMLAKQIEKINEYYEHMNTALRQPYAPAPAPAPQGGA